MLIIFIDLVSYDISNSYEPHKTGIGPGNKCYILLMSIFVTKCED